MDKFMMKSLDIRITVSKEGRKYFITTINAVNDGKTIVLNYTDLKLLINALTIVSNSE